VLREKERAARAARFSSEVQKAKAIYTENMEKSSGEHEAGENGFVTDLNLEKCGEVHLRVRGRLFPPRVPAPRWPFITTGRVGN
jgi:hypothetical protein